MLFHQIWLSFILSVASASARLPPVPGQSVYYNSTGLSGSNPGPTQAPSGSGLGTVFRRGLTEASAISASVSGAAGTKYTTSTQSSPTGKPPLSPGSVKPSYFPTGSGASTAATGKPSYASSSIKRTILSTGFTYAKRAIPSSAFTLASTGFSLSSVTRLSTGYTYSRSIVGTMSTSASIALPKSSPITPSRISTGFTYSAPSRLPSGSGSSGLTTPTFRPSTGPTSKPSSLPVSSAISTGLPTSRNVTSSKTATAPSSTSPSDMSSPFKLQIFVIANDVDSSNVDGSYISLQSSGDGQDVLQIVSHATDASFFTLASKGFLQSNNEAAGISAGEFSVNLVMQSEDTISGGFTKSVCQNSGGVLTCATGSNVIFFTCDKVPNAFVEVGPIGSADNAGCVEFLLLVVWGK